MIQEDDTALGEPHFELFRASYFTFLRRNFCTCFSAFASLTLAVRALALCSAWPAALATLAKQRRAPPPVCSLRVCAEIPWGAIATRPVPCPLHSHPLAHRVLPLRSAVHCGEPLRERSEQRHSQTDSAFRKTHHVSLRLQIHEVTARRFCLVAAGAPPPALPSRQRPPRCPARRPMRTCCFCWQITHSFQRYALLPTHALWVVRLISLFHRHFFACTDLGERREAADVSLSTPTHIHHPMAATSLAQPLPCLRRGEISERFRCWNYFAHCLKHSLDHTAHSSPWCSQMMPYALHPECLRL